MIVPPGIPWEFLVSSVKRALRLEEKMSSVPGSSGEGTMMRAVNIVILILSSDGLPAFSHLLVFSWRVSVERAQQENVLCDF